LTVPEDIARLEVQTDEIPTAEAAVYAIQAAVHEDHTAVVIFHVSGKPDFFGFDPAAGILAQLHQPTARIVVRGGEHHAIVVDRRGTVDTVRVGRSVISPPQFTVGRRDSDD